MTYSNFFWTKRKYFSLGDVPPTKYIFNVDRGTHRFFINFDCLDIFLKWYKQLPPEERTLNEVVTSDYRKLVLDIDITENLSDLFMYDFERHISNKIHETFETLNIGIPNILVYNISNYDKISLHFVVSNFIFSAQTCLGLATILSANSLWGKFVDTGVYKRIQFLRIEGSTKYQQGRWKILSESCTGKFKHGLLSCWDDTMRSNINCNVIQNATGRYNNIGIQSDLIKDQFRVRKQINNTVFLQRTKPGFCPQCKRVHSNENAMLKGDKFICWRYYHTF